MICAVGSRKSLVASSGLIRRKDHAKRCGCSSARWPCTDNGRPPNGRDRRLQTVCGRQRLICLRVWTLHDRVRKGRSRSSSLSWSTSSTPTTRSTPRARENGSTGPRNIATASAGRMRDVGMRVASTAHDVRGGCGQQRNGGLEHDRTCNGLERLHDNRGR